MSEKNKETVNKINDAFIAGRFEDFLSVCADDVQWTIVGDVTNQGKESIRQWMRSMPDAEPPKFSVIDPVIAEGDFVVARGEMTMQDKDGKPGQYAYCDLYRFSGEKVVELTSFVVNTEEGKTSGAA